jgi:hypothetical protein
MSKPKRHCYCYSAEDAARDTALAFGYVPRRWPEHEAAFRLLAAYREAMEQSVKRARELLAATKPR